MWPFFFACDNPHRGQRKLFIGAKKVWLLPITAARSALFKDRALPFEHYPDRAGGLERVQKEVMPEARRTKDRYHVQRMANAAVDVVRRALTPGKRERKKGQMAMCSSHILRKRKNQLNLEERAARDWCLGLYPELRLTYDLKEAYCEIWGSTDVAIARRKYAEWLEMHGAWRKQMPKDLRAAFRPLIRVMKNWEEGIFNYFYSRHTNAYTESTNA